MHHRNTLKTVQGGELEHRAGWDLTFNAPKTVSMAALPGHNDRVRTAHAESVVAALNAGQEYTQARMGGTNPSQTTGKWAAAMFEHDTARPDQGYPAPHLHTHVVVFNMTQTEDGQVRSVQRPEPTTCTLDRPFIARPSLPPYGPLPRLVRPARRDPSRPRPLRTSRSSAVATSNRASGLAGATASGSSIASAAGAGARPSPSTPANSAGNWKRSAPQPVTGRTALSARSSARPHKRKPRPRRQELAAGPSATGFRGRWISRGARPRNCPRASG